MERWKDYIKLKSHQNKEAIIYKTNIGGVLYA